MVGGGDGAGGDILDLWDVQHGGTARPRTEAFPPSD